ncbi:21522_t:CDS:2, partial [Gigaspora margarita]
TVFVHEDPKFLRILPQHSQFISAIQEKNPVYMLLHVSDIDSNLQNKSLVPLIPGYKNEFGTDSTFQNKSNTQQTFERSDDLLHYIENNSSIVYNGHFSIPNLLELTSTENVKWLRGFIGAKYSNIFDLEYRHYKAEKEINTIIKSAKRDADHLEAEIEQGNQPNLVLNLQKSNINSVLIQALGNKITKTQNQLNYTKKRLRRSYNKIISLQESLENNSSNDSESSDIEKDQDSLSITSETSELQEIIDAMIAKSKLGSSLFVSTNTFLELIINQPCSACFNTDIATKKYQITARGFSVKINITCNKCSTTMFHKNEAAGIDYSKLVAGAGLVGGVNKEEWTTMLCACGITRQSGRMQYFQKQETFFQKIQESAENSANFALHAACKQIQAQNKHMLEVSFDNLWSHIREASQASGEFIYNRNIEAYHLVEKPQIYENKKGETITINKGNYNSSSKQMEHANLIGSIAKITPTLIEYNMVLGVAVDGDLNSNKTLADQPIVSKIFADLKHKATTVRKKIAVYAACIRASDENYPPITDKDLHQMHYDTVVEHLFDNHSQCWSEICWKVDNPDLVLPEPNLVSKSSTQLNALKTFLKGITQLSPHQSLITKMRTSQNESVNRIKLNYTDKKQDYPKSYRTRHALAVIHNNNGFLEMLQILRQAGEILSFSDQDLLNIGKIWKQREDKRNCNVAEIHKRNDMRVKKIIQQKNQLQDFDWPQVS